MPHEAARAAEAAAWLRKSGVGLGTARHLLATAPQFASNAAYLCQQAAEKALKGFLAWNQIPFSRTHDLSKLGLQCISADSSIESVCRRAERLTVFAWMFRYPGEPDEPTLEEVREAVGLAEAIYDAVIERLPADART